MRFQQCDSTVFKYKWRLKKDQRVSSDIINLNPKILRHPSYVKRYFPLIVELTELKDFINQGAGEQDYVDYKLGGVFELNIPRIEYMIKIYVRPNKTVLFQVSSPESQRAIAEYIIQSLYFIFSA